MTGVRVAQENRNFADRLLEAVEAKGSPVCVGIDPRYDRLPPALTGGDGDADETTQVARIGEFCWRVLQAVAPHVPAVKPQIAYFEVYGATGVALYFQVVKWAHELGLLVIGDAKRNDIGSTAEAYAAGHLAGAGKPDALTVNTYFGIDGLQPFLDVSAAKGKGAFALVRTSNPSAGQVQDFADASGRKLYEHMASLIAEFGDGDGLVGRQGFSSLGAVVGATWPDEARRLRQLMPRQIFLVPGYGAQGGTAADCAACFHDDGRGAIVNASRSVIYAHAKAGDVPWPQAVADAAQAFAADIREALET